MLQKKDLARVVKIRSDRGGRLGVGISVLHGILRARCTPLFARVVKLVDTGDLKSPDHCDRAGSSPAPGTIANWRDWFHENILEGWGLNTSLTSHTRCTLVTMLLEDLKVRKA